MSLRPPRSPHSLRSLARSLGDALAFSSLLAAAVGFALSLSASLALRAPTPLHWAGLAALGAFVVYNVDRLRDTRRDRDPSPERTAFIERHRLWLVGSSLAAATACGGLLLAAPRPITGLCLAIGVLGLLHRRLKGATTVKTLYVSLAWVAACVGMPWLAAGRPAEGAWVAAILGAALAANLILSNLSDPASPRKDGLPARASWLAGAAVVVGAALALVAPGELAPLAWIALAEGGALLARRPGERYRLIFVDGALLVGAGLAVAGLVG